ncbi:MAG: PAS domain-containing protein [Vicinamibacterales bacterium]
MTWEPASDGDHGEGGRRPDPAFAAPNLQRFVEDAPTAMAMFDRDVRYLAASRRWIADYQLQSTALIGRSHYEIFPEIPERWRQVHERALAGEVVRASDDAFVRENGDTQWLNWEVRPWFESAGTVGGIVMFAEDVTARKRAELETLDRDAILTGIAENLPGFVVARLDRDLRYRFAAGAYDELTGLRPADVVGRSLADVIGQEAYEEAAPWIAKALAGEKVAYQRTARLAGGRETHRLVSLVPDLDAAQQVQGVLLVAIDVTDRVVAEEQFRQAQRMEAVGILAGGVAHDFNNILATIVMQVGLLSESPHLTAEERDGLEQIRRSADRATNLTRQLLMFSRRQVMQTRALDLNEQVKDVVRMLRRIIGEDVELRLELKAGALLTRADAGMLDQVLLNLAVNARDAMPGGGRLTIETSVRELPPSSPRPYADCSDGPYVCLRVLDTGSGIAPDVLPRIFEPFFTTKAPGHGTGLGLATVFGIVRQHRGWIEATSEVGAGSAFAVMLPALEAAPDRPQVSARREMPKGTETLLVVEDEAAVRVLMRKLLERAGYTVVEAGSGADGLAKWNAHGDAIRLVLTDLVMPDGMSGFDLVGRLLRERPGLKVLFASGYSAEVAGRDFVLQEGQNFLQKPFSPPQLLQAVRQALDA